MFFVESVEQRFPNPQASAGRNKNGPPRLRRARFSSSTGSLASSRRNRSKAIVDSYFRRSARNNSGDEIASFYLRTGDGPKPLPTSGRSIIDLRRGSAPPI